MNYYQFSRGAKKSDLIISVMAPESGTIASVLDLSDGLEPNQRAFLRTGSPAGSHTEENRDRVLSRDLVRGQVSSRVPGLSHSGCGRAHTGRGAGRWRLWRHDEDVLSQ